MLLESYASSPIWSGGPIWYLVTFLWFWSCLAWFIGQALFDILCNIVNVELVAFNEEFEENAPLFDNADILEQYLDRHLKYTELMQHADKMFRYFNH